MVSKGVGITNKPLKEDAAVSLAIGVSMFLVSGTISSLNRVSTNAARILWHMECAVS